MSNSFDVPVDKPIIVVGLGNPLMGDEGVGLHVVQRLEKRQDDFPNVEFVEGGTSLAAAVYRTMGRRKAVFIDCALMGEEPGTLRRFAPEHVCSVKYLSGVSLHEGDLCTLLEGLRMLGEAPKEVVIFGIQPVSIEPRMRLSECLLRRLDEYVAAIESEISTIQTDGCTS